MTGRLLFTFPGQGPQYAGMLADIPNRSHWLQRAQEALRRDLSHLDEAASLNSTENVQLCLLLSGVAHAEDLIDRGMRPDMTCGLSIGAYAAAAAAGALRFEDAVRLVSLRGRLMQEAYPTGYGMMAVLGLSLRAVEAVCGQVDESFVANYNAESQTVVSGSLAALDAVRRLALEAGASNCVRLKVAVPSHCALMKDAAEKLKAAFSRIELARPLTAYLSGSTGRVLWQPEKIADDLIWNMARRTQWHEAMVSAAERNVRLAVEMPPGSVLTRLTASADSRLRAVCVQETAAADIRLLFESLGPEP